LNQGINQPDILADGLTAHIAGRILTANKADGDDGQLAMDRDMTQDTEMYDLTPLLRKNHTLLEYQSVKLPTGKEILTLLWSQPGESWPVVNRNNIAECIAQWTTDIWDLSPDGTARLWEPGIEYSTGAIFACGKDDVLYGWDMPHPEGAWQFFRAGVS
jgi:hypothetical protein